MLPFGARDEAPTLEHQPPGTRWHQETTEEAQYRTGMHPQISSPIVSYT